MAGAGLDMFEIEPLPLDHPLRRLENLMVPAHRGDAASETLRQLIEVALVDFFYYLDGKPVNLLNPEARSLGSGQAI